MRIVTVSTLPVFCGVVKTPLSELSPMSRVLRALWALTHVAPTLAKSPTWATPRPPSRRVEFSTRAAASDWVPAGLAGELMREPRNVNAYLSERKSHWMPLKVGLEKVSGVRVVRMASPTVSAVWNWPLWADEITTRSNQLL